MAELWGSVVVSLLFWGFANQVPSFFCCLFPCCRYNPCCSVRSSSHFLDYLHFAASWFQRLINNLCVQITTVDEAKTFYPLFGLGANVALIFSGRAVKYFSQVIFT